MNQTNLFNYINHYMENFKPSKAGKWCYEDGVFMKAIYGLYEVTKKEEYLKFVETYYDSMIKEDGTILEYKINDYNIDNILPGVTLEKIKDSNPKFKKALYHLQKQLNNQPRTKSGSFWHKLRYPYQVWLDGFYMGQIFSLTQSKNLKDVLNQLHNIDRFLYNPKKKLFMHAYDETLVMTWANPDNGQSPNVWLRSIGWLAMALVDLYEIEEKKEFLQLYQKLMNGMFIYLDGHDLWYQLVEYPLLPENYQETSGNCMIAYALLKGERLGMIQSISKNKGKEIFETILKKKWEKHHLIDICQSAGLDDKNRDGSIFYYLSEPKVVDEVKGVASFILAFTEYLQIG